MPALSYARAACTPKVLNVQSRVLFIGLSLSSFFFFHVANNEADYHYNHLQAWGYAYL